MNQLSETRNKYEHLFQEEFQKLNAEQQQAVEIIEGPVMVLAGPGTGKTQVLALRVANILRQTDVGARGILALTFTDTGAQNMRERLVKIVGVDAYAITISTFHAFCGEVIREHPEHFPQFGLAQPLADQDKFDIVESILEHNTFRRLRPMNAPFLFLKDILTAIGNIKKEGISVDDFRKIVDDERILFDQEQAELKKTERTDRLKNLEKQEDLLEIYRLYELELSERGMYDFNDMLISVSEAFLKDEDLLRKYQERYSYFLADEYQDTNGAQNKILDLLASFWGEDANIFVVGDIHQSIYRFQGASLENTLGFLHRYPRAEHITLRENYRSGQTILNAAASILQQGASLVEVSSFIGAENIEPLHAASSQPSLPVRVAVLPTEFSEHTFVAEELKKRIADGVKPSEIAVLVRENQEAADFARVCAKLQVPVRLFSGQSALAVSAVQQAITLLRAIQDIRTGGDVHLFTLLSYPWTGVSHADLLLIARYASEKKQSLGAVLLQGKQGLPEYTKMSNDERIWSFIDQLKTWSQDEATQAFPEWVEKIFQESGLFDVVWQGKSSVADLSVAFEDVRIPEQLAGLQTLFDEIKKWARLFQLPSRLRLETCLKRLDTLERHHLSLVMSPLEVEIPAVSVLTTHRAKGMEWEYVYVAGCADGNWGNKSSREKLKLPNQMLKYEHVNKDAKKTASNEDDRRLFYVAMTRAKKQLTMTYSRQVMKSGKLSAQLPSLFLTELKDEHIETVSVDDFLLHAVDELKKFMLRPAETVLGPQMKEWLAYKLRDFVLSPTALNTYLECPRKFLFGSLAKIPRAKSATLSYGTSIHAALEYYFRGWLEKGIRPAVSAVLGRFETRLKAESLTDQEYLVRLGQGQKELTAYLAHYEQDFREPISVERTFGYNQRLEVSGVRIGGKVDKIEWVNKALGEVGIIDYKTGRARSRNEIEGLTKNSSQDYKRQLVFYRLLADLDRTFVGRVAEVGLDFVQPTRDSGAFKKEMFVISDQDVETLKQTIKEASTRIHALDFSKTTDYSSCEECAFKQICWPDGELPLKKEQMSFDLNSSPALNEKID